MTDHDIDAAFDIVLRASGEMAHQEVDTALATLEELKPLAGGGWPQQLFAAYQQLLQAKQATDRAQALEDAGQTQQAEALWHQARQACDAAELGDRMQLRSHLGASSVAMEDSWPQVVQGLREYILQRRLRNG
jgi:hypothetical protein